MLPQALQLERDERDGSLGVFSAMMSLLVICRCLEMAGEATDNSAEARSKCLSLAAAVSMVV